jgi:hypothetical protein
MILKKKTAPALYAGQRILREKNNALGIVTLMKHGKL